MARYDVIVLGVGGMGSAACYQLAKRGAKVLGIDQFSVAHGWGSSHGKIRLIRRAYFEHADYVPLLNRAYELWDELGERSGKALLHRTGVCLIGPDESPFLKGALLSAGKHAVPVETLSAEETSRRFPQFRLPAGFRTVFEPGGGYVEVESAVETHCQLAQSLGAVFHFGERVARWFAGPSGVTVKTDYGTYEAGSLVMTAGPWSAPLLTELGLPLTVRRAVQFWFPSDPAFRAEAGAPCFAFDLPYGFLYGFPSIGSDGVKIGDHTNGAIVDNASNADRTVTSEDGTTATRFVRECLPGVSPTASASSVCLYTMTPDEHFIIDTHPAHPNLVMAAGFSGHGFKFATCIGEALADLALAGKTSLPIDFLRLGTRFAPPAKAPPAAPAVENPPTESESTAE